MESKSIRIGFTKIFITYLICAFTTQAVALDAAADKTRPLIKQKMTILVRDPVNFEEKDKAQNFNNTAVSRFDTDNDKEMVDQFIYGKPSQDIQERIAPNACLELLRKKMNDIQATQLNPIVNGLTAEEKAKVTFEFETQVLMGDVNKETGRAYKKADSELTKAKEDLAKLEKAVKPDSDLLEKAKIALKEKTEAYKEAQEVYTDEMLVYPENEQSFPVGKMRAPPAPGEAAPWRLKADTTFVEKSDTTVVQKAKPAEEAAWFWEEDTPAVPKKIKITKRKVPSKIRNLDYGMYFRNDDDVNAKLQIIVRVKSPDGTTHAHGFKYPIVLSRSDCQDAMLVVPGAQEDKEVKDMKAIPGAYFDIVSKGVRSAAFTSLNAWREEQKLAGQGAAANDAKKAHINDSITNAITPVVPATPAKAKTTK